MFHETLQYFFQIVRLKNTGLLVELKFQFPSDFVYMFHQLVDNTNSFRVYRQIFMRPDKSFQVRNCETSNSRTRTVHLLPETQ